MTYLDVTILGVAVILSIIQSIEIKSLKRRMSSLESGAMSHKEKLSINTFKVKASLCYIQYLFKVKKNMLASERYEIVPKIQKSIESEAKCIGLNPKDVNENSLYWTDIEDDNMTIYISRGGAGGSASGS